MLTPAQVIPFLSHEDPGIRSRARRYLVSANDPAPATAEDFWAAADKLPPEEAGPLLDRLGLVPQTDSSLKRLLDELPKADPATRDSLQRTLERVDFELLKRHWDSIRESPEVTGQLREHLQARLDLANEPPEPLWDRMIDFARSLGERQLTEAEELEADRLIEAVARHPELFRDRLPEALSNHKLNRWDELMIADIAGAMKLPEAVGPLLDKLKVEEGDLLWDVAADALVHIGDENVVRQIAERFASESSGFRISAADVLGRIKRPQSQAALLEALKNEPDPGMASSILAGLLELCPTDEQTWSMLRQRVQEGQYDRRDIHLDEDLLELATMTGVELPEAEQWREQIARNRAQWALGMSNVEHGLNPAKLLGPSTMVATPLLPPMPARPVGGGGRRPAKARSPRQPFRKAEQKVGRNDPCPCGSGKKHKKCCGK